jgi:hypothetical protein
MIYLSERPREYSHVHPMEQINMAASFMRESHMTFLEYPSLGLGFSMFMGHGRTRARRIPGSFQYFVSGYGDMTRSKFMETVHKLEILYLSAMSSERCLQLWSRCGSAPGSSTSAPGRGHPSVT